MAEISDATSNQADLTDKVTPTNSKAETASTSLSPDEASKRTDTHQAHVDIKLFVGRVPSSVTEEQIRALFEPFGEVLEAVIIRDKTTGNHKGSAFVRMASVSFADAAIRAYHQKKILEEAVGPLQVSYATGEEERLGFPLGSIKPNEDEAKLFVGNLPRSTTEEELQKFFSAYGKVFDPYIIKDYRTHQSKGCAFIRFAVKEEAILAIRRLRGTVVFPGSTKPLGLRLAESRKTSAPLSNTNPRSVGLWKEYFDPEGRAYYHNDQLGLTQWELPPEFLSLNEGRAADVTGPPGANVFIFHIPTEWTRNDLLTHFSSFGYIVSARVVVDPQTGRNKGYGFVSYDNVSSAVRAVQHMNLLPIKNKRLRVSIKSGEADHARAFMDQQRRAYPAAQQYVLFNPQQQQGYVSNPPIMGGGFRNNAGY